MCVKISKKDIISDICQKSRCQKGCMDSNDRSSSFCLSQLSWKTPSPAPNQLQFSRNFAPLSVRVNCRKERGGGCKKGERWVHCCQRAQRPVRLGGRGQESGARIRATGGRGLARLASSAPGWATTATIAWQARGKTAFFYTVLFCPVGCPSYGQYPKKGFWIWILGVFLILKTRVAIT